MTYPAKLSLMSAYRIRKILVSNQYKIIANKDFETESQLNLDEILNKLYFEKTQLEYQVNQLEKLARMHQVLVEQKALYGVEDIEVQVFKILGLN